MCTLLHVHDQAFKSVLVMTSLESQQSDRNFGRYPCMLISLYHLATASPLMNRINHTQNCGMSQKSHVMYGLIGTLADRCVCTSGASTLQVVFVDNGLSIMGLATDSKTLERH